MMRPALALASVFIVAFWVGVVAVPRYIAVEDQRIALQLQEMNLTATIRADLGRSVAEAKAERERSEQLDEHLAYVRGGDHGLMLMQMVHMAVRAQEQLVRVRSLSAHVERWAQGIESELQKAR